ncbi:MAG: hypothetical protein AAF533_27735 [Acidobacteriota bacterium]
MRITLPEATVSTPSPEMPAFPAIPPSSGGGGGGGKVILGCGIACAVLLVLGTVGCGALAWFGLGVLGDEVKSRLGDNPILVEHLGELQEVTMDIAESMDNEHPDILVFRAVGTQASGKLTVEMREVGGEQEIVAAELELDDGRVIDLFPEETDEGEAEATGADPDTDGAATQEAAGTEQP